MMEIQKIKQRSACCRLIVSMGIEKSLTRNCGEEELLAGCRDILDTGMAQPYSELTDVQQELLIKNAALRKIVLQLYRMGAVSERVSGLLEQMDEKEIREYPIEKLYDVLSDNTVQAPYITLYLRYYADMGLLQEEKRRLQKGLDNYFAHQDQGDEEFFQLYGKLLYSDVVSGQMLSGMSEHYTECLWSMAQNEKVLKIMETINRMCCGRACIDDAVYKQINADPEKLERLFRWSDSFYKENESGVFCQHLLENHALLYDLERLRKKVDDGKIQEAHQMIGSRSTYIYFFYNEYFDDNWCDDRQKEEIIIYAATHKKKAFLSLVRNNSDVFRSLPSYSLLFQKSFYSSVVNINTLNAKNLKQCQNIKSYPEDVLRLLSGREYTFEEVSVLQDLPLEYAALYAALRNKRVDERLKVMRELIKRKCVRQDMDTSALADKLSLYPLSEWVQSEFSHIAGLNAEIAMRLLQNFDKLKHLVKDIKTVSEARYVAGNAEIFSEYADMDSVRSEVLERDREWLQLRDEFGFDQKFIQDNKERIMAFLYEDGAHIMWTYYEGVLHKKEELRRLISAELMGRFAELKYHDNDLDKELDYPITEAVQRIWRQNLYEKKGSLCVWEEDRLLPVMKMGEMPIRTCLSYVSGIYKQCLLASHDSNKKVLYVSWNGNIVMRAAVRLTKGMYGDAGKKDNNMQPQLEFVDLTRKDMADSSTAIKSKEFLVLFLEKHYEAGIPQRMVGDAMSMIFCLMKRKAAQLGARLVMSMGYGAWKPDEMVCSDFSVYISKSKAGEQYLDSLNGSNTVDKEGSYRKNRFLVCAKA